VNLDDAKTIARSWTSTPGQSREAARVLLVELERVEAQLQRVRREYSAEMARTVRL